MTHPTDRSRRKSTSKKVQKATVSGVNTNTNLNPSTNRMKLSSSSLPSLKQIQGQIYEEARQELRFPASSSLYKQMLLDPNIATAYSLTETILSKAEWVVKTPDSASDRDKEIAEMLNYNMLIMDRDWSEYITEFFSYAVYGFCTPEKIYKKLETPVGNFVGWKDFRVLSQDTVERWLFDDTVGDLKGLRQNVGTITGTHRLISNKNTSNSIDLPRKKFLLFRNSAKRNNPEGTSLLRSAYVGWKYKSVIEEAETISAARGLGGVLNVGVSVDFLSDAAADPSGWQAGVLADMRTQAANFSNGDQAFIETPLAYDDRGNKLFSTEIIKVEGADTNDIIKRHDHRILMTFFADVLSLGSDGKGSFALSDNKMSMLMVGIESHLKNIKRTLNHDLIRQTYELNGWEYDARTSARFEYDDIDDGDIGEFASAIQKIMAVGAIRKTDAIETVIRDKVFDLEKFDGDKEQEIITEQTSGSGEGLKEGLPNGSGDTTSSGGNRAVANASGGTT